MQPLHLFFLGSMGPKSGENRVFHLTCYSKSSFLALLCITISNVTGVLQYTRITALCNTSVIFLAVQNNYLQGHNYMLVPDFDIIITKTFPAALMLSPFGFYATY